mmetsp:Transcript_12424/g.30947  ORF Transcript_12424/g.30947 Transcript_12424/m.30947 type:complete len:378 (+) Transcript_12424:2036-3169(+)
MAQAEHVTLVDIPYQQLLENIVQRLIGVRNYERSLIWESVMNVGHDLHGSVRLARPWGTHDHRKPRVHRRAQCFHLHRREADGVHARHVLRIRASDKRFVGLHDDDWLRAFSRIKRTRRARRFSWDCEPVGRRRDVVWGEVLRETHFRLRERLCHMRHVEEGVKKVERSHALLEREIPIGSATRISITKEDILQPLRDDQGRGHQGSDRIQNRLEVVLLSFAPQQHVERLIHIGGLALGHHLRIDMVLRGVQQQLHFALLPLQRLIVLRLSREHMAFPVNNLHHLGASHTPQPEALRPRRLAVLCCTLCWCLKREQEDHIVTTKLVPFRSHLKSGAREGDGALGAHLGRSSLAQKRLCHFEYLELLHRQRHPCPTAK